MTFEWGSTNGLYWAAARDGFGLVECATTGVRTGAELKRWIAEKGGNPYTATEMTETGIPVTIGNLRQ